MKKVITLIVIVTTCFYSSLQAQFIYPNEDCSGALPIPISTTGELSDSVFQRNVYAAPVASSIPNCGGGTNVYNDLWYRFTANDTSIAVVPEAYSGFYQLFSGGCGSLTSVTCNPGNTVFTPLTGLTIGQQYYLRTFAPVSLAIQPINYQSNYKLSLLSRPTNDDCGGAALLPVNHGNGIAGKIGRFNSQFATPTVAPCLPASNTLLDVWYRFVATNANHSIYAEAPNGTSFFCYSGTSGSFTQIGNLAMSNSVLNGVISLANLTIGQTYYIRVGASSTVPFKLYISEGLPSNDECANADTVLMSASLRCAHTFTLNRMGATNSTTSCTAIPKDVWVTFQAVATDVIIRATGPGGSNLDMGLLSGSCGSLTCLTNSTNAELFYSGLTVGDYYYLRLGQSGKETQTTAVCICTNTLNDECAGAENLIMQPYKTFVNDVGYNSNATQSLPRCTGTGIIKDVWFKFTATDTACLITVSGEASYSSFEVFSGNCGSLNSIFCSQPNPSGIASGLTIGNTYYVRYYGLLNDGLFSIDVNTIPSNDDCNGARVITPQSGLNYEINDNGILYASQSMPPCAATTYPADIWYQFTATQNSAAIISHSLYQVGASSTNGIEILSGTCSSLSSVLCFSQSGNKHEARTLTNLTIGQTYFIRQYGNVSTSSLTVVNPPANDNINNAIKIIPTAVGIQSFPSYSLHGATKQFNKICSSGATFPYHDVWFYFIASATSHTVNITSNNSFWEEQNTGLTYRIEAFDGYAPDSATLATKLISCAANTVSLTGLNVNDTVYVRVYNISNAGLTSIFGINITNNQSIDDATGALQLNLTNDYQYEVSTSGATQSLPPSGCLINDFPDDDIWFKFTANANAKRIIAGYETKDITLQLFSGTAANLTALKCENNIMVLPNNLTNGTVYYVRAYSKANAVVSDFKIGLFNEADPIANNCVANNCIGTNLISNPRCESEYAYLLPKNDKGQAVVPGTKLAEGWWASNYATADVWNADYPYGEFGNIPGNASLSKTTIPRSGKGMLGMLYYANWSEYVTGSLTQPLTLGKNYIISFNAIMSSDLSNPTCLQIGAYLGTDSLTGQSSDNLEFTPHIANAPNELLTSTNTWKNICGILHADQPYQYITIGNFGNHSLFGSNQPAGGNVTYFFIDDVVVAEAPCSTIGVEEINPKSKSAISVNVFPNPAKDNITVRWNNLSDENLEIKICDISGRTIWQSGLLAPTKTETQISTEYWAPGFYTVVLHGKQASATTKFVVVR